MDNTIVVIIIFAVVIIAVAIIFRHKLKVLLKGPGGLGLGIDASNQPPSSGITIERAKTTEGSVVANDGFGHPVTIKDAKAKKDIRATSTPPGKDSAPKKV